MTASFRQIPILLATTNPGKLREFKALLAAELAKYPVYCLEDLPAIAAPEEDGDSFFANARIKALYYSQSFPGMLVVAEDSGLEVRALGNEPGIRSARFAGEPFSDQRNIRLLLQRLEHAEDRGARFVTEAVLARDGRVLFHCRREVNGTILKSPRGKRGFGYDPVFYYPPLQKSFAELEAVEKNAVSHRGRAMQDVSEFLCLEMRKSSD